MADSKSGRKGVALFLAGMVLGAALITPAGAHVTSVAHSWKKHFLPLAKKAFYTKTQSNAKYLGKTAKAANADKLDGLDSNQFTSSTSHAWRYTDECDAAGVWNQCGVVQVVVPSGKTYHVSVWSSATAAGNGTAQNVTFCAGRRLSTAATPSCITPIGVQSGVTIPAAGLTAFASSGETTVDAGTWSFSLAFKPAAQVAFSGLGKVVTKVLVRDAATGSPVSASAVNVSNASSSR